jgi:hypothetical protein
MPIVAIHTPVPHRVRRPRTQRHPASATLGGVAVSVRSSPAASCGATESAA